MIEWSMDKDFWARRIVVDHQLHRHNIPEMDTIKRLDKNSRLGVGSDLEWE
jgi:hypothetical protein